jgi:hypothetical protein
MWFIRTPVLGRVSERICHAEVPLQVHMVQIAAWKCAACVVTRQPIFCSHMWADVVVTYNVTAC